MSSYQLRHFIADSVRCIMFPSGIVPGTFITKCTQKIFHLIKTNNNWVLVIKTRAWLYFSVFDAMKVDDVQRERLLCLTVENSQ